MPVRSRTRLRRARRLASRLDAYAQQILAALGESHSELSVELVGDRRMRRLNWVYRGIDRPTDVLAFATREALGPPSSLLGDVVISIDTAQRQAKEAGHSLEQELLTLLIHGILHLLGYDHERGVGEARRMQRKERALFEVVKASGARSRRRRSPTLIGVRS